MYFVVQTFVKDDKEWVAIAVKKERSAAILAAKNFEGQYDRVRVIQRLSRTDIDEDADSHNFGNAGW